MSARLAEELASLEAPGRPAQGRHLERSGARLYFEEWGQAGEPLLLLHGGSAVLEVFLPLLPGLGRFRRILPDLRGHGRSTDDHGTDFHYETFAEDALALLDLLGVERTSVIGWSDGGIIALYLALRSPERVRRLVVIGSHCHVDALTPAGRAFIEGSSPESWDASARQAYESLSPHPERWSELVRKLKALWLSEPRLEEADLQRIEAPVLVVAGAEEAIPRSHFGEVAAALPRGELCVIPGAGHFVLFQQPAALLRVAARFLEASSES